MSSFNPLEEFAIDLAHKFRQLKTFDEGNTGFRYIGIAKQCNLDAKRLVALIKQEKAYLEEEYNGQLTIDAKSVTLPSGLFVTSVFATFMGDSSGYIIITITDSTDVAPGIDMPVLLDIRTSDV